jgi:hypothetical protein
MNSPFVLRLVKASAGSYLYNLLQKADSTDQKITALFERFLVRRPEPEELASARQVVSGGTTRAWEDLQWLLVNKVEFVHNF